MTTSLRALALSSILAATGGCLGERGLEDGERTGAGQRITGHEWIVGPSAPAPYAEVFVDGFLYWLLTPDVDVDEEAPGGPRVIWPDHEIWRVPLSPAGAEKTLVLRVSHPEAIEDFLVVGQDLLVLMDDHHGTGRLDRYDLSLGVERARAERQTLHVAHNTPEKALVNIFRGPGDDQVCFVQQSSAEGPTGGATVWTVAHDGTSIPSPLFKLVNVGDINRDLVYHSHVSSVRAVRSGFVWTGFDGRLMASAIGEPGWYSIPRPLCPSAAGCPAALRIVGVDGYAVMVEHRAEGAAPDRVLARVVIDAHTEYPRFEPLAWSPNSPFKAFDQEWAYSYDSFLLRAHSFRFPTDDPLRIGRPADDGFNPWRMTIVNGRLYATGCSGHGGTWDRCGVVRYRQQ